MCHSLRGRKKINGKQEGKKSDETIEKDKINSIEFWIAILLGFLQDFSATLLIFITFLFPWICTEAGSNFTRGFSSTQTLFSLGYPSHKNISLFKACIILANSSGVQLLDPTQCRLKMQTLFFNLAPSYLSSPRLTFFVARIFTEPLRFAKSFLNHWLCRHEPFELEASHVSPQCFEEAQMFNSHISNLVIMKTFLHPKEPCLKQDLRHFPSGTVGKE